jgi:hypothetical protein
MILTRSTDNYGVALGKVKSLNKALLGTLYNLGLVFIALGTHTIDIAIPVLRRRSLHLLTVITLTDRTKNGSESKS